MAYELLERVVYSAGTTYQGPSQKETINFGFDASKITQDNSKKYINYGIESAAAQKGYILLSVEHNYQLVNNQHQFQSAATYTVKGMTTGMSMSNKSAIPGIKLQSMQFELIPIWDLVAILIAAIIGAIIIYVILESVAKVMYGPPSNQPCNGILCKGNTSGYLLAALAVGGLVIGALLFKDRTVRSLY